MADPTISNALFISHNAADRPYAVALETAIKRLIEGEDTLIDVRYSTSDEAGPQGGEKWREWIYTQVIEARVALIVVTPHALGKPWLLWEAGACRGAGLMEQAARADSITTAAPRNSPPGSRMIVSIAYGLAENECPDPLRGDQIIRGADVERMRGLFGSIVAAYGAGSRLLINIGARMEAVVTQYQASVRDALRRTPSLVTEANVQDWLARLDELVRLKRLSELGSFERWMALAFGRDGEGAGVPIDVRLHRRLGELYLQEGQFAPAAEQLKLARWAAPRDIYVLRPLAELSMKRLLSPHDNSDTAVSPDDIESLLTDMEEIDQGAFVSTPDAAALRGKYLRRVKRDHKEAIRIYRCALEATPQSYYLADVLAQTELESGLVDEAKASFRRALDIVEQLREKNKWTHAAAATACLALDDLDGAQEHLSAVGRLGPSKSEIDAIAGGFREVARRLGHAAPDIERLLAVLIGDRSAQVSSGS